MRAPAVVLQEIKEEYMEAVCREALIRYAH